MCVTNTDCINEHININSLNNGIDNNAISSLDKLGHYTITSENNVSNSNILILIMPP